eukprot:CAMPEP_0179910190 /NCGR_PEP_ID=MMETSP0982-20121206/45634_1 /TAXON_ID=483367 /ORGANISM="non described non described, Strain CCMP 2436" /LENGTH=109 /DNA_ID=CAMNT_0021811725 /DNA_START=404 /DNA_END=734 /DNA_ORIENTATION=+
MIANNVPNVVSRAERGASPTDSRATPTTTTAVPANAPALHQMVRQGSLMLSTGFVEAQRPHRTLLAHRDEREQEEEYKQEAHACSRFDDHDRREVCAISARKLDQQSVR